MKMRAPTPIAAIMYHGNGIQLLDDAFDGGAVVTELDFISEA